MMIYLTIQLSRSLQLVHTGCITPGWFSFKLFTTSSSLRPIVLDLDAGVYIVHFNNLWHENTGVYTLCREGKSPFFLVFNKKDELFRRYTRL